MERGARGAGVAAASGLEGEGEFGGVEGGAGAEAVADGVDGGGKSLGNLIEQVVGGEMPEGFEIGGGGREGEERVAHDSGESEKKEFFSFFRKRSRHFLFVNWAQL